jgi:hypothetical protein
VRIGTAEVGLLIRSRYEHDWLPALSYWLLCVAVGLLVGSVLGRAA